MTWEIWGMRAVLRVSEERALACARAEVDAELAAIDHACNRFRGDSELTRLNERAGRPVRVSPILSEALALALRAGALSGGAVDLTVGGALERAGYDRDFALLEHPGDQPAPAHAMAPHRRASWREVRLEPAAGLVRVPRGVKLDLGATAKAWAVDRAVDRAASACACAVLLGIGGDIASAGTRAGGWGVRVTDDHRSTLEAPGQTVRIAAGALATSSTVVRRWHRGAQAMHHIIDPATGAPARGPWRTASVAAATCADANIAATAALVKGDGASAWLARLDLPARLVAHDGAVERVGGWPAPSAPAGESP